MKVVLFCGGLGTRLREHSDTIPKPLVNIGYQPILWHLMRYYAHFGHNDFILCLGYRGDMIRQFFLEYDECLTNDFVMSDGGRTIELMNTDIQEWRITFVDTGLHSNIGERLLRVRHLLEGEEMFMANYADALTDLPLDDHIRRFQESGAVGGLLAVRTSASFHSVQFDDGGWVTSFGKLTDREFWLNAGYFNFTPEIFDYIEPGEELVENPFERLIGERRLQVNRYTGFWQQMDTFREKILYDRMEARGDCPWMLWRE
ncbi:MAG: sugar phosphate nucleotidyltransferase [Gemmatimonadota bacterium]